MYVRKDDDNMYVRKDDYTMCDRKDVMCNYNIHNGTTNK